MASVFGISLVALATVIATILPILRYLRYIPDILVLLRNPSELMTIHNSIIETYYFKKFWKPIVSGEKVVVVFPAKDLDDHREGTSKFDHQGLQQLLNELNSNFRNLEIEPVSDDQFGNEHKSYDIISVAGPIPNRVSQQLLYETGVQYTFDKLQTGKIINVVVSVDGEVTLEPDTYYDDNANKIVCTKDYGIITRVKSPYNNDKEIINVAGGYGEGTLAGCQILQMPSNLAILDREGGRYFQALYSVDVSEDGVFKEPYLLSESSEWKFDPIISMD
jgi:hypothetical protein